MQTPGSLLRPVLSEMDTMETKCTTPRFFTFHEFFLWTFIGESLLMSFYTFASLAYDFRWEQNEIKKNWTWNLSKKWG